MAANRVKGIRAGVFYGSAGASQTDASGNKLNMTESLRSHNDANVLSLGARFLSEDEAKEAVTAFLSTTFSSDPRHARRISKF
jgi:ribose 5-phosphate isomerase B